MRSRVELFEAIRRDHEFKDLSKRELARKHAVHRRTVNQALVSAIPPPRKRPEGRPAPKLGPYHELIDSWLEADTAAPPKQRHTAKRIWQRLLAEQGAELAETTVRDYVRKRKRELGLRAEGHVPQAHDPGAEAEVDWGEAKVLIAGELRRVHLFVIRLSHSGAAWVEAFERETQQAFLEAHANGFEFLGGVPAQIRYDNLRSAVVKILRGRRRIESNRFVALRSHYLFSSFFCEPGQSGAHEKGGVEGEVGRFRRNHLVPVPEVADLAELNAMLRAACEADLGRRIAGREQTIGAMLAAEHPALRPLPAERFDCRERSSVRVDSKSLATVRQNRYSVPVELIGRRVEALIGAREIEIVAEGATIASHERSWGRHGVFARLSHYAPLLARKPGALAGSLALAQERERGQWPACFDELWERITERTTPSEAARQMVDVVMLCGELGAERVELAVRGALAAGAYDGRAVALLAHKAERPAATEISSVLEAGLARASAPPPDDLADYDQLLGAGQAA
jgi:transposase